MKKIIIHSYIEDTAIAVNCVARAIHKNEHLFENGYEPIFTFNHNDKELIVASFNNKNSIRFNVYYGERQGE